MFFYLMIKTFYDTANLLTHNIHLDSKVCFSIQCQPTNIVGIFDYNTHYFVCALIYICRLCHNLQIEQ